MESKHIPYTTVSKYKNFAFIVIAILILLIRKSDSLSNPQLWAEDGTIFFSQQYNNGAASIFTGYAGYLLLVPRLIAAFADSFFSYASIPAVYNYTSFVVTILVLAHCFSPRLQLPWKPLFALAIVLVPHPSNEIFLTITNIQWILCLLLILTLLKDSPDIKYGNYTLQIVSDFMIVIVAGLTGPFLIIIFPFFAWKLFRIKKTYGYTLLLTACCMVLIQLFYVIPGTDIVQEGSIFNGDMYLSMFGKKFFGGLFFGRSVLYGNALVLCITMGAFFSILLNLSYTQSPKDLHIVKTVFIMLSISCAMVIAAIARDNFSPSVAAHINFRYLYVPYVLVTWSLILCLNQQKLWKNIFVITSLLLILYSSISVGVRTKMTEFHWQYYSSLIGTRDSVSIPINPNWHIILNSKKK